MRILFTGSSSFTGYWFIKELVNSGYEVIAVFSSKQEDYSGIRKKRVDEILNLCKCVFECKFGSEAFLSLTNEIFQIDLFCHHYADVTNYKSSDFDVLSAINRNAKNIQLVLKMLAEKGCNKILLTGSFFEQNEGVGSDGLRAFSPYGFSKGVTSEIFKYYTLLMKLKLGKFVIPNPFGPYEEARFTGYLVRSWFEGNVPQVATPAYVRDNIHVSLLAKAYVMFAESLTEEPGFQKINPSGYAESQRAFAERLAREMRLRLPMPCELTFAEQKQFPEPKVRINTDLIAHHFNGWNEKQAWDELADYYQKTYK